MVFILRPKQWYRDWKLENGSPSTQDVGNIKVARLGSKWKSMKHEMKPDIVSGSGLTARKIIVESKESLAPAVSKAKKGT